MEREAVPVADADIGSVDGFDVLEDRNALAGERTLLDLQRRCDEQSTIGGSRLPASISTMSPGTSPSESISMASPSRRPRAMFFNIFCSAPTLRGRLRLATQAEHGVEHRQEDEHNGRAPLLGDDHVHDCGAEQQDLHEVLVLAYEGVKTRTSFCFAAIRFGPYCSSRRAAS